MANGLNQHDSYHSPSKQEKIAHSDLQTLHHSDRFPSVKLSIITINRNNAAGLARTLASTFRAQPGFDDWEQIVVDGASTDGSFGALAPYKDDPHLGWHISEPDSGIYNAMNKGAAHATGTYLIFLNAGDTLLENSLSRVFASAFDEEIVYGDILLSKSIDGRTAKAASIWKTPDPADVTPAYFLLTSLPHQACLISRSLHESMGGYDESLRVFADGKFFLSCIVSGQARLRHLSFAFSQFSEGGISTKAQCEEPYLAEREEMLTQFFGRYVAHRIVYPPERRWLRAHTAQLANKDPAFARYLGKTARFLDRMWSVRLFRGPARFLLKVR